MDPFIEWLFSQSVGQVAAWVGITVGAIVFVWKGWPAFKNLVKLLSASIKLVETLATLPDDLKAIKHELEHNGGGSVKDSVVRTEEAVKGLTREVGHIRRQSGQLKTAVARTNRRIDEHLAMNAPDPK
jgi:hypothetical protein